MWTVIMLLAVGQIPHEYATPYEVKETAKKVVVRYAPSTAWDGAAFKVWGPKPSTVTVTFDGKLGRALSSCEQASDEGYSNARRRKVVVEFEFAPPPPVNFDWKKMVLETTPYLLDPANRKRAILIDDLQILPGVSGVRNQVAQPGKVPGITVTFQAGADQKHMTEAVRLGSVAGIPVTVSRD